MDIVSTDPGRPGIFAFSQYAVGIFAFGQASLGVVAVGQLARGVFCLGQGAVGVVCVGQGALGLWYATGMLGVAGQRGWGIVLHLLPRLSSEPKPELEPTTPIADLRARNVERGWIGASLSSDASGAPRIVPDEPANVDTRAIAGELVAGLARGLDRVHLAVRADLTVEPGGYREAESHIDLVAERAVVYPAHPRQHLAYASAPASKLGAPASTLALIARTIGWLVLLAIVVLVSLGPLAKVVFGLDVPFMAF